VSDTLSTLTGMREDKAAEDVKSTFSVSDMRYGPRV
jgi:hypothetical protein